MKVIKGIYAFIVGDWIILSGILLAIALLAVIHFIEGLAILRNFSGLILVVATLAVLIVTLSREAYSRR
ncbi:MAG: hypothetical protein J2P36_00675 [Ktedonobacteraceae bacterium]|nr:hypothetical protein [Ktedonobacteraceae bacterium]